MDKTIPYVDIVMRRAQSLPPIEAPALPEGIVYTLYKPGDEKDWARVETLAGEFDCDADARRYFDREFAPHEAELKRRMVFLRNELGEPIATATAWHIGTHGESQRRLHWVAVVPSYQGKGLGRAVTMQAMHLFEAVGPAGDAWLTTQTWSYRGMGLYLDLGFCAISDEPFAKAVDALRGKMRADRYRALVDTAILPE